jgi:chaperonin GroES
LPYFVIQTPQLFTPTPLDFDTGGIHIGFCKRTYFCFNKNKDSSFKRRTKKMQVRPLNDRVLVKRLQGEEKTAGGIIIPDTAKEKPIEGLVVAVGTGKLLDNGNRVPVAVKEGNKILFSKYAGTEVKIANEEHLIMREDDILGVIEN